MRAPILSQLNKWRQINYSKWLIYKDKLNSPPFAIDRSSDKSNMADL